MGLDIGSRLGHYHVTALIGEGGMGEVYRARDTKLDRDVALKVLPEAFTQDPDRLARFEREAKVLASLNHPNIAAIYGLEEAGDTRALVLELVEGPTLADRIKQGPIPLDEALPVAKQIAEALEAAHEAGVIHRDLKPANIKVKDDGTVKVLDFGLAKALDPNPGGDPSQSPTLTAAATQMGVTMGTAAYMSPEQARGKPTDRRADIWAFGAVLFEMLTGTRVFEGEDVSVTLANVIKEEPQWGRLPEGVSQSLQVYLQRCLEKDPTRRVQAIGDVRLAIDGVFEPAPRRSSAVSDNPNLRVWQRPVPAATVVFAIAAFAGVLGWMLSPPRVVESRVQRFTISPAAPETVGISRGRRDIAISPDGSRVVYTGSGGSPFRLLVRPVDALAATPLETIGTPVLEPFVSPDGAWLGFLDGQSAPEEFVLKRVSILGGPAVTICDTGAQTLGADWGEDDTIVFGNVVPSGLWHVAATGGDPVELTIPGENVNHAWPDILPGGRGVLFTILRGQVRGRALSTDGDIGGASEIAVLDLETGEQRVLVAGGTAPRYSPTGHIVYGVSGTLRAVGFDVDRLQVTHPTPVPVLPGVMTKSSGAVNFDLADDGSLVYVSGGEVLVGGVERTLAWVDRDGYEEALDLPPRVYGMPRLSPDAIRLAVTIPDQDGFDDVWVADLARGTLTRLTTTPGQDSAGLWSPDGERVVFASDRDGSVGLYSVAADDTNDIEHLATVEDALYVVPSGWSPDGDALVFEYSNAGGGPDIGVLLMEGEGSWRPLIESASSERGPTISPDGQWIAYTSDESGERLVYVDRFPELGRRITVSRGHAHDPVWAPDGRELFHLTDGDDRTLTAVPVQLGADLHLGEAVDLFEGEYAVRLEFRDWDVSPDGQRFVRLKPPSSSATEGEIEAILVQNWFEELKRLVPVD